MCQVTLNIHKANSCRKRITPSLNRFIAVRHMTTAVYFTLEVRRLVQRMSTLKAMALLALRQGLSYCLEIVISMMSNILSRIRSPMYYDMCMRLLNTITQKQNENSCSALKQTET